jgi:hypothetical protein
MPIYGDVKTMCLTDLLQWAAANRKTGVLELERNKVCRRIEFRNGWIGACSSDDPPSRLGQFLLARGKITKEALREALDRQQESRKNLGMILLEMGALSQKDLQKQVAAKAEETIQGLFDWEDAIFRFHEGATLDPNQIEVNLSVDDILLKGIQHHDELQQIREVFESSGVVLAHTERKPPKKWLERPMARRIFESIDGKRTLAEILLHAHASEFLVIKLLYTLHRNGLVEVAEVRPVKEDAVTLLDPPSTSFVYRPAEWESFAGDASLHRDIKPSATAGIDPGPAEEARPSPGSELDAEIEVAHRLLSRGEYEAALELLYASYRAHPSENHLRRLIDKAESAYVEHVQRHGLTLDKVPVPVPVDKSSAPLGLGPQESYLISLLDGNADVRSIIWVAPLREVDVLRTLRQMLDQGLIELREAGPGGTEESTSGVAPPAGKEDSFSD